MPILSKPSSAARTSLIYITLGALMLVWTVLWRVYLRSHPPEGSDSSYYFCYGFMASGAILLIIGLAVGQIGRSARNAELPPSEVTHAEVVAEQNAAARAPIIAPVNPAAPAITPTGQAAPAPAVPATPGVTIVKQTGTPASGS